MNTSPRSTNVSGIGPSEVPNYADTILPSGTIVKGRAAIGDLFAAFCKEPKDGGLNGIEFVVEQSTTIENMFAIEWVVTAPFLQSQIRAPTLRSHMMGLCRRWSRRSTAVSKMKK